MNRPPRVALVKGPAGGMTAEMLRGISRYVREHRQWDLYCEDDPMFKPLPSLRGWRGDGILCFVRTARPAQEILDSGIPAVNLSSASRRQGIPQVSSDNIAVGRLAAESLLTTGLSRFAFVGMSGIAWSDERRKGFESTLESADRSVAIFDPPRPLKQYFLRTARDRDWDSIHRVLLPWIESLELPVGILAANDVIGRHVIEACHSLSLEVPERVAVVGVDNEVMRCELCIPPLSSVDTDQQRLGYEAAALLEQMMNGEKPPREPWLVPPREVVVRQSSNTLAVNDPEIAQALNEIRQRRGIGIRVAEVVQSVGLSRRSLQLRMRAAVGRTMAQEISRVRTEHIQHLLARTDLSLARIAKAAGFASVARMAGFFRGHSGTTLARYRKRFRGAPNHEFPRH